MKKCDCPETSELPAPWCEEHGVEWPSLRGGFLVAFAIAFLMMLALLGCASTPPTPDAGLAACPPQPCYVSICFSSPHPAVQLVCSLKPVECPTDEESSLELPGVIEPEEMRHKPAPGVDL